MEADDRGLSYWLRKRKQNEATFLFAIDRFEELFTFADPDDGHRCDRLLAAALEDPKCPLFITATVRADLLDRFADDLTRLIDIPNRLGKSWKLAPIGTDSLRYLIYVSSRTIGILMHLLIGASRPKEAPAVGQMLLLVVHREQTMVLVLFASPGAHDNHNSGVLAAAVSAQPT